MGRTYCEPRHGGLKNSLARGLRKRETRQEGLV